MSDRKSILRGIFLGLAIGLSYSNALAFKFSWSELISDTLYVSTYADSLAPTEFPAIQVSDERGYPPTILGVQQTKKWNYIPVDQYIALNEPLATQLSGFLQKYQILPPVTCRGSCFL